MGIRLMMLWSVQPRRQKCVWRMAAAAVSFVALVAGCTVGPDFEKPQPPDTKGYEAGGEPQPSVADIKEAPQHLALGKKISGDWWQLFHSPQLDDVLRQAIAGNQTLVAAEATLAQSLQTVRQVQGAYYPQVDLTAGASRQRINLAAVGINQPGPTVNLFTIGPTVSYALDPFGGNRRRTEQQEALAETQDYQLDAAYLTLTGNAVAQALAIASTRAQIRAVESIIADDEQNLKLVQSSLAAGEATQIDVQSANSQLQADRTLLPPLRQQLSVARHALSVLLSRAPADWSPPEFDLEEFTLPEELPVSLPSELVRQRPDILASEAQLHAASAAIGVATAQLYPDITLSASYAQEAAALHTLFNPSASVFNVGANLLAPVFHGGALRAQERAALDAYERALADYRQTVLESFGQVADVLDALGHDAELVEAQRRALEAADVSLRLTRASYTFGNASLLQVLDALRLDEQARLGYVRAQAQRYFDTVQLFTAMGGGWWDWKERAGQPVVEGSAGKQAAR
jgi:NodT family efflux transporter outer membrane factor (OMF) lipoprotein